ncbi:MAG: hypothetical protein KJO26_03240, partial [Deltaproteobacteria bacterium]|nr:hypothetical protein [Deltaproteobacteria bacterium]
GQAVHDVYIGNRKGTLCVVGYIYKNSGRPSRFLAHGKLYAVSFNDVNHWWLKPHYYPEVLFKVRRHVPVINTI